MKYFNLTAAIFALVISAQAWALETASTEQMSDEAKTSEIVLQHDFVEMFSHLNEPRYGAIALMMQNSATHLFDKNATATITAKDAAEAALVEQTYRRYGAMAKINQVIEPGAKSVTIRIHD